MLISPKQVMCCKPSTFIFSEATSRTFCFSLKQAQDLESGAANSHNKFLEVSPIP